MNEKDLIITTAKDLMLKAMDGINFGSMLASTDKTKNVESFGDQFKIMVKKVEEAYKSI